MWVNKRLQETYIFLSRVKIPGGNNNDDDDDETYTVCKLQIGLFADINKWQSKLDGIANKYDTADEEGLHGVYTGEWVAVRRHFFQAPHLKE